MRRKLEEPIKRGLAVRCYETPGVRPVKIKLSRRQKNALGSRDLAASFFSG
jgi:hypothetical protein